VETVFDDDRLVPDAGLILPATLAHHLGLKPGRLTRSARRVTLHLPARWPWAIGFGQALARFRAIPLLA